MKSNILLAVTAATALVASADTVAKVDFTQKTGVLRPALHSSGWTPRSYPRGIDTDDDNVKAMNLTYARTHD